MQQTDKKHIYGNEQFFFAIFTPKKKGLKAQIFCEPVRYGCNNVYDLRGNQ